MAIDLQEAQQQIEQAKAQLEMQKQASEQARRQSASQANIRTRSLTERKKLATQLSQREQGISQQQAQVSQAEQQVNEAIKAEEARKQATANYYAEQSAYQEAQAWASSGGNTPIAYLSPAARKFALNMAGAEQDIKTLKSQLEATNAGNKYGFSLAELQKKYPSIKFTTETIPATNQLAVSDSVLGNIQLPPTSQEQQAQQIQIDSRTGKPYGTYSKSNTPLWFEKIKDVVMPTAKNVGSGVSNIVSDISVGVPEVTRQVAKAAIKSPIAKTAYSVLPSQFRIGLESLPPEAQSKVTEQGILKSNIAIPEQGYFLGTTQARNIPQMVTSGGEFKTQPTSIYSPTRETVKTAAELAVTAPLFASKAKYALEPYYAIEGAQVAVNPNLPTSARILGGGVALGIVGSKVYKYATEPIIKFTTAAPKDAIFMEVRQPVVTDAGIKSFSKYKIIQEVPGVQVRATTRVRDWLGMKPTVEGAITKTRRYITETPFWVEEGKPFLTLSYRQGAKYGKISTIEGGFANLEKESISKLPKTERYLWQQAAEQRVGRPVLLKNVPKVISKDVQLSRGIILNENLVKARFKGSSKNFKLNYPEDIIPYGRRTSRFQIGAITKEVKPNQVYASDIFYKDVTKISARASGKIGRMKGLTFVKEPIDLTSGNPLDAFTSFKGRGKSSISKLETPNIIEKQKFKPVSVPIPKTPRVQTIPKDVKSIIDTSAYPSITQIGGRGTSKFYGRGAEFEKSLGEISFKTSITKLEPQYITMNKEKVFVSNKLGLDKTLTTEKNIHLLKINNVILNKKIYPEKLLNKEILNLDKINILKLNQKLNQKLQQKLSQRLHQKLLFKQQLKIKTPPGTTTKIIPKSISNNVKTRLKQIFAKGYSVLVRRKGRIETIGKNLPYSRALELGVKRTKAGTEQTFALKESGLTALEDINFKVPSNLFGKPKRAKTLITPLTFTELRGKTLTTGQEILSLKRARKKGKLKWY